MPSTKPTLSGPVPEPEAAAAGHGVGRGDERVGAVVDVEHGALGTLEQDAAAGALQLGQAQPDRLGEGQQLGGQGGELGQQRARRRSPRCRSRGAARCGGSAARGSWPAGRRGRRGRRCGWRGAPPCPRRPGRCRGRWCRSCRCPGCCPRGRVSRARSSSPCSGRIRAAFSAMRRVSVPIATPWRAQALDLLEQRPGIDHDAVADQRELALADHARRQQRQLVGGAVDDQRVAGIVAALEADHDVGALAEPVDDLALALVAPLGADDGDVAHGSRAPLPGRMRRWYTGCRAVARAALPAMGQRAEAGEHADGGHGDGLGAGAGGPAQRQRHAPTRRPSPRGCATGCGHCRRGRMPRTRSGRCRCRAIRSGGPAWLPCCAGAGRGRWC